MRLNGIQAPLRERRLFSPIFLFSSTPVTDVCSLLCFKEISLLSVAGAVSFVLFVSEKVFLTSQCLFLADVGFCVPALEPPVVAFRSWRGLRTAPTRARQPYLSATLWCTDASPLGITMGGEAATLFSPDGCPVVFIEKSVFSH